MSTEHAGRETVAALRALAATANGVAVSTIAGVQRYEFTIRRVGVFRDSPVPENLEIARAMLALVACEPAVFACDGEPHPLPAEASERWTTMERCGEWSLAHPRWPYGERPGRTDELDGVWCIQGSEDNAIWILSLV